MDGERQVKVVDSRLSRQRARIDINRVKDQRVISIMECELQP